MKRKSNDSLYLTPLEAAAILRVDRRTVYEWLRKKKIPAVKFGDSWRILRTDVAPGASIPLA